LEWGLGLSLSGANGGEQGGCSENNILHTYWYLWINEVAKYSYLIA
jgi:hypothetical protein